MQSTKLTFLRRTRVAALCSSLVLIASSALAQSVGAYNDSAHYTWLDARPDHLYEVGIALIPDTTLEGDLGATSQMELDARWRFLESDQFMLGVLKSDLIFDLVAFSSDADVDLPEELLQLYVDFRGVWRYTGGYALELGIRPGVYASLDGLGVDSLHVPFSAYFHSKFNRDMSGIVGLEIRPGFGLGFMPTLGMDWALSDSMLLRLAVPESRFDMTLTDSLDGFMFVEWNNTSYTLNSDDLLSRDTMTLNYIDAALGVSCGLGNGLEIGVELGGRVNRTVEFEEFGPAGDNDVKADSSVFTRISIRRPL